MKNKDITKYLIQEEILIAINISQNVQHSLYSHKEFKLKPQLPNWGGNEICGIVVKSTDSGVILAGF